MLCYVKIAERVKRNNAFCKINSEGLWKSFHEPFWEIFSLGKFNQISVLSLPAESLFKSSIGSEWGKKFLRRAWESSWKGDKGEVLQFHKKKNKVFF